MCTSTRVHVHVCAFLCLPAPWGHPSRRRPFVLGPYPVPSHPQSLASPSMHSLPAHHTPLGLARASSPLMGGKAPPLTPQWPRVRVSILQGADRELQA